MHICFCPFFACLWFPSFFRRLPFSSMLQETDCTQTNPALFCKLANTLATCHETKALKESEGKPTAANDDLKKALDVCNHAASVGKPMDRKHVLWTRARVQRLSGIAVTTDGDETTQLLTIYECMRMDLETGSKEQVKKLAPLLENCAANPELFSRLAQLLYKLHEYKLCIEIAKKCIDSFVEDGVILPKMRRWLAQSESLFGQALMGLIDPLKHEKPVQDSLRQQAASHYVTCARHGAMLNAAPLVVQAMQLWWNAMLPFMSSAVTREVLTESLAPLVDTALQMDADIEPQFRLKLLVLLLEALSDKKQWKRALLVTDQGLARLPTHLHNQIWEMRVGILGALGRNPAGDMSQMKDTTPQLQAKVLLTLGTSADDKSSQLNAYHSALDVLSKSPLSSKVAVADTHAEFSQWLFNNSFAIEDAQDQLMSALDVLADLDPQLAEDVDDDDDDDEDDHDDDQDDDDEDDDAYVDNDDDGDDDEGEEEKGKEEEEEEEGEEEEEEK